MNVDRMLVCFTTIWKTPYSICFVPGKKLLKAAPFNVNFESTDQYQNLPMASRLEFPFIAAGRSPIGRNGAYPEEKYPAK